jgi:protein phosphatase
VPKLIHPLPPPVNLPESSPDHGDAAWMQVRLNILFVVKIGLGCK